MLLVYNFCQVYNLTEWPVSEFFFNILLLKDHLCYYGDLLKFLEAVFELTLREINVNTAKKW